MAKLALSGLASGVDTDQIVSQLMQLERQSLTRFNTRQKRVQAQDTALKDIQSKLKTLKTAAEALRSNTLWKDAQSVTSSDPTRVEVAKPTGVAPPGAFAIEVTKLAAGARQDMAWTPPSGASELTLTHPTAGTTWTLSNVAAGTTVDQLVTAINADTAAPVYASRVGTGADERLVLSTRATGSDQVNWTVTLKDVATATSSTLTPTASVGGADAAYTVDGVAPATPSKDNTITVGGLELTLKAPTSGSVVVTSGAPALDKAAVKDKVKAFVTAYNDVVTATRGRLDERTVKEPASDFEAAKGALFSDSGLSSMLSRLRVSVSDRVTAIPESELDLLSEIGISTGKGANAASTADAKIGKLTIDDAKLDAVLSTPLKVRDLLGGTSGLAGFAQRIESFVDTHAGTSGTLAERVKGNSKEVERLKDQAQRAEDRIAAKEKRLRAQFAAMESVMAQSQTRSAWLAGQLNALG